MAVLAPASVCSAAIEQPRPVRTVLTIHWGAEDFPGTAVVDAAIRQVLEADAARSVNYYAEYLESEEFPAIGSAALHAYIRRKFAGQRIDVVIANTTPALQFALRFRDELFAGVPIVFVAGQVPDLLLNRPVDGVTGIVSDVAFAETLDLALSLHPTVRRVFVVAHTPLIPDYTNRVRSALSRFAERIQLTYIHEKTVPSLLNAVRAVPDQSLILYTRYVPEIPERHLYTDEIARLMAGASAVPIYSTTDLYIGTGVVGGIMRGSRTSGVQLGEMALKILNGVPARDIPVERVRSAPIFDWRQVRRWNIDPSRLPPGSDIRFRTPTAWESYRWQVVGISAVVVSQMLLIVALLTHRTRRRRAETALRGREAALRSSYERTRHMAGRLINAQEAARAAIARDLHDDLCQKLVIVSMGVTSLKRSSTRVQDPETQLALSELEGVTNSVFDGIRRLSHDLHPPTLRLLGLAPTLKTYCREVEKRHAVDITYVADRALGQVHADVAVCFFRIAQEALRNGLGHGDARRFDVSLRRSGKYVELLVADDGSGFDLEAVLQNGQGLGLISMEERAHGVGGHVEVVTSLGQGTTIRVTAPADLPY